MTDKAMPDRTKYSENEVNIGAELEARGHSVRCAAGMIRGAACCCGARIKWPPWEARYYKGPRP